MINTLEIKCICNDVPLIDANYLIKRYNIKTIEELQDKVKICDRCKRCEPYILELIKNNDENS